jgi:hypothetical protein
MVKMLFMESLLVVRCEEMGNEAYKETCLLQLVTYKVVQIWPGLIVCEQAAISPGHIWTTLYIVSPAIYEIIYEALGIYVMHWSMYIKHASTDVCQRTETALISKELTQLSAIKIFQHKY